MLTNTIRALALLGLIAIAHAVRPLSLENVSSFALQTFRSFAFVLPAEAKAEWAQASAAATMFSRGWVAPSFFANRDQEPVLAFYPGAPAAPAKVAARRRVTSLHRPAKQNGWLLAGQVKVQARGLAAPLPFIPGIEASLIQGMNLLVFPASAKATARQFPNGQTKSNYTDCEGESEPRGEAADIISKPFKFVTPARAAELTPQALNGQACGQQPGKPANRPSGKSC